MAEEHVIQKSIHEIGTELRKETVKISDKNV